MNQNEKNTKLTSQQKKGERKRSFENDFGDTFCMEYSTRMYARYKVESTALITKKNE